MQTMQHRKHTSIRSGGSLPPPQDMPLSIPSGASPVDNLKSTNRHRKPRVRTQRHHSSEDGRSTTLRFIGSFILIAVLVVIGFNLVQKWQERQFQKFRNEIQINEIEPLSREWEERIVDLEEEKKSYKKQAQDAKDSLFKLTQGDPAKLMRLQDQAGRFSKQLETAKEASKRNQEFVQSVHKAIQEKSLEEYMKKFGEGPHRVEMELAFDPKSNIYGDGQPDTQIVILETAPEKLMPHTVYWFLEQVDRGLYNGCSFHRNAGHVVQAGPAANFLSPPDHPNYAELFKKAGFDSVLFQEYSSEWPHTEYTVGYAGRPGGPDFYINLKDNSKIHGPGGQTSYADPTEADPCFAKVVEGKEAIDRMAKASVKEGGYKRMEHYVAIKSMKIVRNN